MAGRKPIPSELKKLKGTNQPCRAIAPQVETEKITDINSIIKRVNIKTLKTKRAKDLFKEKANQLIRLQMLTDLDLEQLVVYAWVLDQAFTAAEELNKNGRYTKTYDENGIHVGYVANPNAKVFKEMSEMASKIGSDFGFTPVARLKLKAFAGNGKKKDPFEDL